MKEAYYLNLISKEELLKLDYDPFYSYITTSSYREMLHCLDSLFYTDNCYALYIHNFYSREHSQNVIRIVDINSINSRYCLYICPAIKLNEEDMAKKQADPLIKNRLGLTPGKIGDDIADLPPITLDYKNSVYDSQLKKRVPVLGVIDEKKEIKTKSTQVIQKSGSIIKNELLSEDGQINNTDSKLEDNSGAWSGIFLEPEICTRIWVLDLPGKTSWAWFVRPIDGFKNKFEFYCRPNEIANKKEWKHYDRGGSFVTYAFRKAEYQRLDNEILSHKNLQRLKSEIEGHTIEINYLIDAFLLNMQD